MEGHNSVWNGIVKSPCTKSQLKFQKICTSISSSVTTRQPEQMLSNLMPIPKTAWFLIDIIKMRTLLELISTTNTKTLRLSNWMASIISRLTGRRLWTKYGVSDKMQISSAAKTMFILGMSTPIAEVNQLLDNGTSIPTMTAQSEKKLKKLPQLKSKLFHRLLETHQIPS